MSEPRPYDADDHPSGPYCTNWNHPAYERTIGRACYECAAAFRNLWHTMPYERMLIQLTAWLDLLLRKMTAKEGREE